MSLTNDVISFSLFPSISRQKGTRARMKNMSFDVSGSVQQTMQWPFQTATLWLKCTTVGPANESSAEMWRLLPAKMESLQDPIALLCFILVYEYCESIENLAYRRQIIAISVAPPWNSHFTETPSKKIRFFHRLLWWKPSWFKARIWRVAIPQQISRKPTDEWEQRGAFLVCKGYTIWLSNPKKTTSWIWFRKHDCLHCCAFPHKWYCCMCEALPPRNVPSFEFGSWILAEVLVVLRSVIWEGFPEGPFTLGQHYPPEQASSAFSHEP